MNPNRPDTIILQTDPLGPGRITQPHIHSEGLMAEDGDLLCSEEESALQRNPHLMKENSHP